MEKKAMSKNKRTRSFRCPDPFWNLVEKMAKDQDKKPTDVIIDALASHVGELIRKDRRLTAQQITSLVVKCDKLEKELASVRQVVGERSSEHEPENENTS